MYQGYYQKCCQCQWEWFCGICWKWCNRSSSQVNSCTGLQTTSSEFSDCCQLILISYPKEFCHWILLLFILVYSLELFLYDTKQMLLSWLTHPQLFSYSFIQLVAQHKMCQCRVFIGIQNMRAETKSSFPFPPLHQSLLNLLCAMLDEDDWWVSSSEEN